MRAAVLEEAKAKALELEELTKQTDYQYYPTLLKPKNIKQLAIDAEDYDKKITKAERDNPNKSEIAILKMEFVGKRDSYKATCGLFYDLPLPTSRLEKNILINLFKELNGYTWYKNFGWIGQSKTVTRNNIEPFEASPTYYDGITIELPLNSKENMSYVTKVNLSGFGCDGKLSDGFCKFEKCIFLNLNYNLITGNLSKNIKNLKLLQELNLSCNLLTGIIDIDSIKYLNQLKKLNLSYNKFIGNIPESIGNLTLLEYLNLSCNQFNGELPDSLSKCIELKELKLYNNQLIGCIPISYSLLKNLKLINISQNKLNNGMNVFNQCIKLQQLLLNHNQFNEKINPNILNLKKLEILYLQNNFISGVIPNEICHLNKLKRLNLSHNRLRGLVPINIGDLCHLESLLLTGNFIIGPMPLSISNIKNMKDFHIFKNYPSEMSYQPRAFNRKAFDRIYVFGPSIGIDSIHWDYMQLYGRDRSIVDNESVTVFTGSL